MTKLNTFPKIDVRRLGAVALALGIAGLGADAAIAHFAGREMKHVMQLVPVFASPLLLAMIVPFARRRVGDRIFRTALRAAGGIAALVGLTGSAFHANAFLRLLEGETFTWKAVELALAVAPPLAAPAAFLAMGGLLVLLASPRIELKIKPAAAAAGLSGGSRPAIAAA